MNKINAKDLMRIKKSELFDSDWYLKTYPDVAKSGMEPVEHFCKYGGILRRDPSLNFSSSFHLDTRPGCEKKGINPLVHYLTVKSARKAQYHYVLWAAYNVACKGNYKLALELAKEHLPEELQYTLNILLANKSLENGDDTAWLIYVNEYLKRFYVEPIKLDGSGHILGRLKTDKLPEVNSDKKISIIMPAWNAEETVEHAANSILNQTWRNIELIIVDDASQDGTWGVLERIASYDDRVKIIRNKVNVGPYVSKNVALKNASGDYVTGQDADDWAHPQRLENHIKLMKESSQDIKASLTYMIRIQPSGFFGHIGKVTGFSFDGVARKASISCLFERKTLQEKLGFWDSVRFGADSEMIARAKKALGDSFAEFESIGMICLDLETSLTNHSEHGVDKVNGISPIRKNYRDSWVSFHNENVGSYYLSFPQENRKYDAGLEMQVPFSDQVDVVQDIKTYE